MAETKPKAKAKTPPKRGTGPTHVRHRKERAAKLREIRKQVKDGTLTIRPMTAAERKKYPPQPRKAKSGRGRARG
jgi:hypothetical protein